MNPKPPASLSPSVDLGVGFESLQIGGRAVLERLNRWCVSIVRYLLAAIVVMSM
jgi:hypothetical protein